MRRIWIPLLLAAACGSSYVRTRAIRPGEIFVRGEMDAAASREVDRRARADCGAFGVSFGQPVKRDDGWVACYSCSYPKLLPVCGL